MSTSNKRAKIIKIAESHGWRHVTSELGWNRRRENGFTGVRNDAESTWYGWWEKRGETPAAADGLPAYFDDLNAIHEAFSAQPYGVQQRIVEELVMSKPSSIPAMAVAFSSAADWAEALLQHIDK